jgi:hypothetical protein
VPGGKHLGIELLHRSQQLVKLDLLVADDTRNRCFAGNVAFGEGLHNSRLEALLVIQDIVRDAELIGHPARIVNVLSGTTGSPAPHGLAMVVKLQGDADHIITLLLEQGGSHGRVDASGHGDNDAART